MLVCMGATVRIGLGESKWVGDRGTEPCLSPPCDLGQSAFISLSLDFSHLESGGVDTACFMGAPGGLSVETLSPGLSVWSVMCWEYKQETQRSR